MSEPNDKLLDEYLRGESPVSQRYRELEAENVPPQLDAAVLAQAHAAVAQRKRKPSWVRWGAPLALAASAVMAVAIVLEVGVQDEVRLPAPRLEQPVSAERAQEARVVEEISPDVPAEAQRVLDVPLPQAQLGAPPPVEIAEPKKAEPAAPAFVPQPTAGTPAPAQAEQDSAVAKSAADERARERASSAAPNEAEAVPARPGATPAISRRASYSTVTAAPAQEAPRLSAEEWLERIRALRREGKVLEADEQWREFVKTYPDVVVSETDSARPAPQP